MKVCMVVPNWMVKGGIASVVNGYKGSQLEKECKIFYVESYCDGSKLRKLLKAIQGYCSFLWVLIIDKPDLLHIHSSFGASFYRKIPFIILSNWFKCPVINHIHGAEFDNFYTNASERKKTLIKKVYNKCNKLIALSDEWKDNLSQIVSNEKIVVIPNYSQLHYEAYQERKERKSNHQVLFLGEIGKRKGCFDIPAVIKQVAEKIPDVLFVIAGDGTEEDKKAVQNLVHEFGVEKNVVFPGWIRGTQKDEQLRDADVFFLPSYNEGMPMSILDAMGYGLPIVSTNVGGIPEIVLEGKNGYCCNPGDIENIAKAIFNILGSEKMLKSYSEKSFQMVENQYSLFTHLNKLKQVYLSCIK